MNRMEIKYFTQAVKDYTQIELIEENKYCDDFGF